MKPAVESGFEVVKEGFAVEIESAPPQGAPALWLASEVEHPLLRGDGRRTRRSNWAIWRAWTSRSPNGAWDSTARLEREMSGEPETGRPRSGCPHRAGEG